MGLVLVKDPSIEVSTPWAYAKYKELKSSDYLKNEAGFQERRQILRNSPWLNKTNSSTFPPLRNDLQKVVAPITPAVENGLTFLSSLNGSISIAMSGSGPSCFALFSSYESAKSALDQNRSNLKKYGLHGWCCSFQSKGVHE